MLTATLQRLAREFTARDIMVPRDKLVCAMDEPTARKELEAHPDFNLIPIQNESGRLVSFLLRDEKKAQNIDMHQHIVGDAISVLDLVDVLAERPFCFVMVGTQVGGYIHFSDLNNRIAELTFYIIIQAVEYHFMEKIRTIVTEDNLEPVLGEQRAKQIKKSMISRKKKRAELDLLHLLSMREVLKFARRHVGVVLDDAEIEDIYDVRNSVAHAPEAFIKEYQDVARLVRVKKNCFKIMGI